MQVYAASRAALNRSAYTRSMVETLSQFCAARDGHDKQRPLSLLLMASYDREGVLALQRRLNELPQSTRRCRLHLYSKSTVYDDADDNTWHARLYSLISRSRGLQPLVLYPLQPARPAVICQSLVLRVELFVLRV